MVGEEVRSLNVKYTLLALAVLIIVAGGYFLLKILMAPEVKPSINLYGEGYSKDDVVRIYASTDKSSQNVVYQGKRYWVQNEKTKEFSLPAKQEQIYTFFSGLEAVQLLREVERGDKNLSEWRLGKEARKLELTYGDGTKREIFMGADNPAGRGMFMRFGGRDDMIYLVTIQLRVAAEAVLFQLVEDRILLSKPEEILSFSIHGKKTEKLKENQVTCARMDNNNWNITVPITKKADAEAVDNYLAVLSNFRFETIEDTLISRYEKEEPILVFSAKTRDAKGEDLLFYPGGTDVMARPQYVLFNKRTGLIGRIYPTVFSTVNQSFISFIWRRLFHGNPSRIETIHMRKGSRNLTFVHKREGGWIVSEYFDAPVDSRIMAMIIKALQNFRVSRFISDDVRNLGVYGLKSPSAVLTVKEFESEESLSYCYYFGKQIKGTEEVYFKEVNANEIYAVKYDFVHLLSSPAPTYAMRRICDVKKERIDRIKIITPEKAYKFYKSDIEGWYLREPFLTRHIDSKQLKQLLTVIEEMEYHEIPEPETVPFDAFDVKNTDLTLEVHAHAPRKVDPNKNLWPEPEKNVLVIISKKKDRKGNVYGKRKFTNLVFTLKPEQIGEFRKEYIDTSVFIDDISAAVNITLDYAGSEEKVQLDKKGDTWRIIEPKGKKVDEKAVIGYLRFLNNLKGAGIFLYKTDKNIRARLGFDKPVLKFTVSKGVEDKHQFTLIKHPKDPKQSLIRRNEEVYILQIPSMDTVRILVKPSYFMLSE
jgi:hypothetical protein